MIDLVVQALNCEKLDTSTKLLVAIAIARRCGGDGGRCWAKQATLARDTRLHTKTVSAALKALEDDGLIERIKYPPREDGTRQTDDIFLTLPAVTLAPTKTRESRTPRHGVKDSKPPRAGLPKEETKEETNKDLVGFEGISEEEVIRQTIETIWSKAGINGRRRSSKGKVESAVKAAFNRRSRNVTPQNHADQILRGVEGYLKSPEASKDGGAFEKGTHRIIQDDFWMSWLDAETETRIATGKPLNPELGSMEAPSEERQRMWMELYQRGMTWDVNRGPRPGLLGCRVTDSIQREFGVDPYAPVKLENEGEAI